MDKLSETLLEKMKKMKGISETDKGSDDVFSFAIETAVNEILDYCHIKTLPKRLYNTAVMMAIDIVNEAVVTANVEGEAKDIKEGDMSITKETKLDVIKAMSALPSFTRNYTRKLNSHRQLAR